ncbi:MAG: hypothetical protein IK095_09380 [Oscillospiraceae bacterium]|nr:hypothetical protein [Oscillospiraceae bacterium]
MMLRRELIKIALCLLAGVLVVAFWPLLQTEALAWFLVPLYVLGTLYGFRSLAPKIWSLISGMFDKLFMSVVLKSTLGCLLVLLMMPIALSFLLAFGWISGMVCLVKSLREAVEADQAGGGAGSQGQRSGRDFFGGFPWSRQSPGGPAGTGRPSGGMDYDDPYSSSGGYGYGSDSSGGGYGYGSDSSGDGYDYGQGGSDYY